MNYFREHNQIMARTEAIDEDDLKLLWFSPQRILTGPIFCNNTEEIDDQITRKCSEAFHWMNRINEVNKQ